MKLKINQKAPNFKLPSTGKTIFELLKPPPPKGKMYVRGRLTKKEETTRPPDTIPELWTDWSRAQRRKAIEGKKFPAKATMRQGRRPTMSERWAKNVLQRKIRN